MLGFELEKMFYNKRELIVNTNLTIYMNKMVVNATNTMTLNTRTWVMTVMVWLQKYVIPQA